MHLLLSTHNQHLTKESYHQWIQHEVFFSWVLCNLTMCDTISAWVLCTQSPGSAIRNNATRRKCHSNVTSMESCKEYYMGEGDGLPIIQIHGWYLLHKDRHELHKWKVAILMKWTTWRLRGNVSSHSWNYSHGWNWSNDEIPP